MSVLVIAEHDNAALAAASRSVITAASALGTDVHVLVAGSDCRGVADEAASTAGVAKVRLAEASHYARPTAEDMAALVVALASGYTHVLAPATTFGKNFMPRVAALMDVAAISDIVGIESEDTFERPIYAGNAIATVRSADALKVITVRGTAFEPAAAEGGGGEVEAVETLPHDTVSEVVNEELTTSDRPELTAAEVVISGGRGVGSGENFQLLEVIADKLNAAIGASRAAVDAGYVPNDYQVGQTGKIVAPKLYIAVGISGAIQHLAGMKDSKVVVAINKDEEAPIFQVADYGLVGDLFKVLPALKDELDRVLG
ncbi:MAG TPA: electron transfer flavoprotein subunit alpha/FixB family protein [Gammaproteobacteria bacterium]|nr:electron transfer flavoprotein subunit alpha/FixB family protein [Gammaproteobacteria bacterium]